MTLIELLVLVNRKLEMGLEPNRTEPLNAKKNRTESKNSVVWILSGV